MQLILEISRYFNNIYCQRYVVQDLDMMHIKGPQLCYSIHERLEAQRMVAFIFFNGKLRPKATKDITFPTTIEERWAVFYSKQSNFIPNRQDGSEAIELGPDKNSIKVKSYCHISIFYLEYKMTKLYQMSATVSNQHLFLWGHCCYIVNK